MTETQQPISFITSNDSINDSTNNSLQEDMLESSYGDNKNLRSRCNELEGENLQLVKENNKLKKEKAKDKETISKMQQSAGKTVGLGNKK